MADTLKNAPYVEFPGLSYFVFAERSCLQDIVADFFEEPDASCVDIIQFNFITY